jgi:dienelactone hydrolase
MKRLFSLLLACVIMWSACAAYAEHYAQGIFGDDDRLALYDRCSDDVKAAVPFDQFAGMVDMLVGLYGTFEGLGDIVDASPLGEWTVYSCAVYFKNQILLMQWSEDAAGTIMGFGFMPLDTILFDAADASDLPDGIVELEVIVGDGEYTLPGILTMPANAQNLKAVVLVHGSGPQDRDEHVGNTRLFRDIAYMLAQNGMASLRYDKRTLVYGADLNMEAFTVKEEMIEDAVAAGRLLVDTPEIDSEHVFLLGHSLGAMQAPRIVAESEGLFCGMVLVAGSPKTLLDILISQNAALIEGLPEDARDAQYDILNAEINRIDQVFSLPVEDIQKEKLFLSPAYYFYEMNLTNNAALIAELQIPTLIMQGGGDFQISKENGLDAYLDALGEQRYIQYKLYPELNHLMMASVETQSVIDYNEALHLDVTAAQDIISFMRDH